MARRQGIRYLRFMDDLLILARSHGGLRRAVATMNRWLALAGLLLHPDKTFIGRVERDFDGLGYRLAEQGLAAVAASALTKMLEKIRRLHEQTRAAPEAKAQRVADYLARWQQWVENGSAARIKASPGWS